MQKKLKTIDDILDILKALKKSPGNIISFEIFADGSCRVGEAFGKISTFSNIRSMEYTIKQNPIVTLNGREIY